MAEQTDQEYAATIKRLVDELNTVADAAQRDGLAVSFTSEFQGTLNGVPRDRVRVEVSRPL